jgi:hypothetical protein
VSFSCASACVDAMSDDAAKSATPSFETKFMDSSCFVLHLSALPPRLPNSPAA